MAILIVDDSVDSRLLMQLILRNSGYHELLTAASARDAFANLGMGGSAITDIEVDLVLMDIMMPEVDGIEACRCIRSVERFRDLPIIMVSGVAETKYLEAAFDAGAIDYITKPINKIEVAARVRSALSLRRAYAELEEKNQILANESLARSPIYSRSFDHRHPRTHQRLPPLWTRRLPLTSGGQAAVARATGASRGTFRRGMRELGQPAVGAARLLFRPENCGSAKRMG